MRHTLNNKKTIHKQNKIKIRNSHSSLTESATEPLKNQLSQLDQQIKEYKEMIENSRSKILQNSEKIRSLLIED